MKYLYTLIFIVILTVTGYSQSVTYSPVSVMAWGNMSNTRAIEFEYEGVKAIHLNTPLQIGDFFGVGYIHNFIDHDIFDVNMGGILFNKKLFSDHGSAINVFIEAEVKLITDPFDLSLSYRHISNGYTADNNVGLDNIGLKFYF